MAKKRGTNVIPVLHEICPEKWQKHEKVAKEEEKMTKINLINETDIIQTMSSFFGFVSLGGGG